MEMASKQSLNIKSLVTNLLSHIQTHKLFILYSLALCAVHILMVVLFVWYLQSTQRYMCGRNWCILAANSTKCPMNVNATNVCNELQFANNCDKTINCPTRVHNNSLQFRVMTFNTFRLGNDITNGIHKVADQIIHASADVILLQVVTL
jgi:hypothetical protein